MLDKLDNGYYWHIVTLTKMKNGLKETRKKELIKNTDQSIEN